MKKREPKPTDVIPEKIHKRHEEKRTRTKKCRTIKTN